MVLNNLSASFCIWLQPNTFYPEVNELWKPQFRRMYLPYLTLEDFFNSQITQISFPSVSSSNVQQKAQNYSINKRPGLQLNHQMDKTFTLTVKLSESYITYFMARQQFDLFLKFGENAKELYMPPISVTILDDGGFETVTYTYHELTPVGLSDFDLSYAARPGTFNTFTWTFSYNYFDIYYRDPEGVRSKLNTDPNDGILKDPGFIQTDKLPENHYTISKMQSLKNLQGREPKVIIK